MDLELDVVLLYRDDGRRVAEIVGQLRLRSRRRIDDETVPKHGLPNMRARRQVQEMVGLRNWRRIAINCPVIDLKIHEPLPNRV